MAAIHALLLLLLAVVSSPAMVVAQLRIGFGDPDPNLASPVVTNPVGFVTLPPVETKPDPKVGTPAVANPDPTNVATPAAANPYATATPAVTTPVVANPDPNVATPAAANPYPAATPGVIKQDQLTVGFYREACPEAEDIVREKVSQYYQQNPDVAAGLLRLVFHDCFVRGCDASILLDETPSGEPTEKTSPANGESLVGLDVIDDVKAALENACPGTVSCADILSFVARDAAVRAGLPHYKVPAGRRDSTVSLASEVVPNLPSPAFNVANLTDIFARKGFTPEEMVVLVGAHSIGGSHCNFFSDRLYNTAALADPSSIDPGYAEMLKTMCPQATSNNKVYFDQKTPRKMDGSYYNEVQSGRGLLESDQTLMTDPVTSEVVRKMARNTKKWQLEFGKMMVKLGALDVLTGDEGEVRRSCRRFN